MSVSLCVRVCVCVSEREGNGGPRSGRGAPAVHRHKVGGRRDRQQLVLAGDQLELSTRRLDAFAHLREVFRVEERRAQSGKGSNSGGKADGKGKGKENGKGGDGGPPAAKRAKPAEPSKGGKKGTS